MDYYFFHRSGNQANPIYVSQELIHILGIALFFPALLLLSFSIYISSNPEKTSAGIVTRYIQKAKEAFSSKGWPRHVNFQS
jgi:hypothetical protein